MAQWTLPPAQAFTKVSVLHSRGLQMPDQLREETSALTRELLGFVLKEPQAQVALGALLSAAAYVAFAGKLNHKLPVLLDSVLDIVSALEARHPEHCTTSLPSHFHTTH